MTAKKTAVCLMNQRDQISIAVLGIRRLAEQTKQFLNPKRNKVKASELAQKFASRGMDMVVAIGASAAIAVAKEIKDVPVILNFVYDPVDAKIAQSWQSSGNNTTGTSPKYPVSKLGSD